MLVPRMTTRRWMLAVAAVALSFGGWRYGVRLKHERDSRLARTTWHAREEARYRRLLAGATTRAARPEEADPATMPPRETSAELDSVIEREFGLPAERRIEIDGHDRFKEAQARAYARAAIRRKLLDDSHQRRLESLQRQADYHVELVRKYWAAAFRPWLSVDPDPPEPE
jgi:hypothetical protein